MKMKRLTGTKKKKEQNIKNDQRASESGFNSSGTTDVGDATSTTSMDMVKVGLEKQVGLELTVIQD